jgi:hypothetical protein
VHPEGFEVIQRFTKPDAEKLVSQFNSRKADEEDVFAGVPIFKKHPKRDGVSLPNDDRRRMGQFDELTVRDDGLYGKPRVNKLGKAVGLKNRFPTAHWFCNVTGKENGKLVLQPFELEHVGLTDRPNLPVAPMFNEAQIEYAKAATSNAEHGDPEGKWITVKGRHVFIGKGESLKDAMQGQHGNADDVGKTADDASSQAEKDETSESHQKAANLHGAASLAHHALARNAHNSGDEKTAKEHEEKAKTHAAKADDHKWEAKYAKEHGMTLKNAWFGDPEGHAEAARKGNGGAKEMIKPEIVSYTARKDEIEKKLAEHDSRLPSGKISYHNSKDAVIGHEDITNMPEETQKDLAAMKYRSKSPYSQSFYDTNEKTWTNDPEGHQRIANHWNFKTDPSDEHIHAKTDKPVAEGQWALGVRRGDKYEIQKLYASPGASGGEKKPSTSNSETNGGTPATTKEGARMDKAKLLALLATAGVTLADDATDEQIEAALKEKFDAMVTLGTEKAEAGKTIEKLQGDLTAAGSALENEKSANKTALEGKAKELADGATALANEQANSKKLQASLENEIALRNNDLLDYAVNTGRIKPTDRPAKLAALSNEATREATRKEITGLKSGHVLKLVPIIGDVKTGVAVSNGDTKTIQQQIVSLVNEEMTAKKCTYDAAWNSVKNSEKGKVLFSQLAKPETGVVVAS